MEAGVDEIPEGFEQALRDRVGTVDDEKALRSAEFREERRQGDQGDSNARVVGGRCRRLMHTACVVSGSLLAAGRCAENQRALADAGVAVRNNRGRCRCRDCEQLGRRVASIKMVVPAVAGSDLGAPTRLPAVKVSECLPSLPMATCASREPDVHRAGEDSGRPWRPSVDTHPQERRADRATARHHKDPNRGRLDKRFVTAAQSASSGVSSAASAQRAGTAGPRCVARRSLRRGRRHQDPGVQA